MTRIEHASFSRVVVSRSSTWHQLPSDDTHVQVRESVRTQSPEVRTHSSFGQSSEFYKDEVNIVGFTKENRDDTVRVWDVSTGFCQQTLGGHT